MDNITPEMQERARQELARRELIRRGKINENPMHENAFNPNSLLQSGLKNYFEGGKRFGKNVAVGLTEAGRNLADLPFKAARGLGVSNFEAPKVDYEKGYGIENEPTNTSDALVRSLAQYAPAMLLPGMNLGKAGEAIGSLPKIGNFLKGAASQAVPQALYSATQSENPLVGAAEGGLGSIAGSALGKLISSGINAVRPSQYYKTPLSKRELAQSFRQTEGTNTDLGNVIENPKLQRLYENKLPKITGEASLMMQKNGQQIVKKGENILKTLLGNNPAENVPEQLTQKLMDSFHTHKKFKNDIYNAVNELADSKNLKLNLSSFADEAKKYMDAIQSTTLLQHEPDAKAILGKLVNYKNPVKEVKTYGRIVDETGKPLIENISNTYPTLKEANILKGKLGDYAKMYGRSPDPAQRNMSNIFKNLAMKLKGDIRSSIKKSGSDVLEEGYKVAEKNYAQNYSPFLDKDIYDFISGKADPATLIQKFIKRSNTADLGGKLSKLAGKLSTPLKTQGSESSNLLAYGYLAKTLDNEGNFNPFKFATAMKNLSAKQLKVLFPDKKVRKEVLNYKSLVNKNSRSLNVMFNPLTGQVNSDVAPHVLANVIGGLTGLVAGGGLGAIIGAAAGPLASKKIADIAVKKLTDPVYRRKFINALIKNKKVLPNLEQNLRKSGAFVSNIEGEKIEPLELEVIGARG